MKNKLTTSILLILMGVFSLAQSQSIVVSGKVTSDDGEMPGVSIIIKGTTEGTVTDYEGNYRLEVSNGEAILVFSFIGYKSQEVTVGNQSSLDVFLTSDLQQLEEVVVVGYGVQRKKVVTAAISRIDAKDIEGFAVPNVANTLQGQVSGVIIKSGSGQPGRTPNILIRGVGTNGDNSPLVIVDGMIFDDAEILGGINPSDIESVNVLKDGASTAIYGARGANGVIIVTTKKGTGTGTIEYSMNFGVQNAWKLPEVLNASQYTELLTEKYENSDQALPSALTDPICSTCDTDWVGDLFGQGTTQTHNFSYSKGTDKSSFRGSFSWFEQDGIIAPEKSNYKRATVRLNSEQQINDYFKFGTNLTYIGTKSRSIEENNSFGGPIATAIVYDPLTPIYDVNAQFGFAQSTLVMKEYINPFSNTFLDNDEDRGDEFYGNAFVEFSPLDGITLKSDLGVTKKFLSQEGYTPSYDPLHDNNNGNLNNDVWANRYEDHRVKWENTVKYTKEINKHKIEALFGYSIQEDGGTGIWTSGDSLNEERFTEAWRYVGEAPNDHQRASNADNTRYAIKSLFGRAIYSYDNKYLFTFILRRDGSTRFGPAERHGTFPSVSAGWVATSEDFWPVQAVSFFKIRASYGENGNDRIPDNRFKAVIEGGPNYQFGAGGSQTTNFGFTTPNAPNPSLKWETSKQIDIGFEAGILDDMITVEFDYYSKSTTDFLLESSSSPKYVGTGARYVNAGEIKNSGIELMLGYTKDFGEINFGANLNVTTLKNKVKKLDGENDFMPGREWSVRKVGITRMEVGQPMSYFRGYKTDGLFRSQADVFSYLDPDGDLIQPNAGPGDLKFVDVNNDGDINNDDIVYLGKPWADLTMGLQLNASYKGFGISAVLFASIGSEIYRTYERQDVANNNYQTIWLDRYHETNNPGGTFPRLLSNDLNANQRPSDFYVESGDFLRMKNIQISYTLPYELTQKVKISNVKIFASVDNVFTITGYNGFDPEIGTSGDILDTGIDKGFYPLARTISSGLSLQF